MPEIAALNAVQRVPTAVNEPVRSYAPGSPERADLKARLFGLTARKEAAAIARQTRGQVL